ncbi:NAD(P)/FAD-dependent oxidoreductase [Cellulomonas sp. P24]|uniref:NAD(P)/FAD-dependent oxidoreductase n=1 Tax=Cellulomonas sp. P24 TaxID=2885206 RepID=UPI00216B2FC7|nr:NAD(P)/FAD-dependent oxidoreductase [Cellulomonas sp. P24]MCR6491092.1 NAD(P)/FAD-dependent oxidoreductase [Cellulomonas sp. P24]
MNESMKQRHRVVVIGSGFGGLFATKALKDAPVDVTIIAKTNHHLFQPLLYQVATGILSEGSIAPPTREILRGQINAEVHLGEVIDIDIKSKTVTSWTPSGTLNDPYDSLIVAAGSTQSYFGNNYFAEHAPGLKSIDDALELRGRILSAFEFAEIETEPDAVEPWLTFVVVGAGPTGVEMAGQIAELAHRTLREDYRRIDPEQARVVLLDGASTVLATFGDRLAAKATKRLKQLGVDVQLGAMVVHIDEHGIEIKDPDGSVRRIESRTKVWAAGVAASPLAKHLANQAGLDVDRLGRVPVEDDCSLPSFPEVFVIGDMMDAGVPGVAQVAMQSGKHVAKIIAARAAGRDVHLPFKYVDKGSMATISRFAAVASVGRFRFSGFIAWLMWLVIHLLYLIGFKQRVTTLLHWTISFVGGGRAERAITRQQVVARRALDTLTPAQSGRPDRVRFPRR